MSTQASFLQAMVLPPVEGANRPPSTFRLDVSTCILFAGDGHSATRLRVQAMIVPPGGNS